MEASAAWNGRTRLSEADAKPGRYYVTARDERGRTAFLVGPFTQSSLGKDAHARALGYVQVARRIIVERYSWGWTYSFGTARLPLTGAAPIGKLNDEVLP